MTSPTRVQVEGDPLPLMTAPTAGSLLVVNRGTVDVFLGDATVGSGNNSAVIPALGSIAVTGEQSWSVVADSSATSPQEVVVVPGGLYYGAGAVEIAEQLLASGIVVVDEPVELGSGTVNLTSASPTNLVLGYTDISRYSTLILRLSAVNDVSNGDNTVIAQTFFYADNTSGNDYGFTIADARTGLGALGLEMPARAKYTRLQLAWTQREGTAAHTITATWQLLGSLRDSSRVRVDRREPTLVQLKNTNLGTTIGVAQEFNIDTFGGDAQIYVRSTSAAAGTWTPTIEADYFSSGTNRTRTIWEAAPFNFNGGLLVATVKLPRKAVRLMLTPSVTLAAPGITQLNTAVVAEADGMQ